MGMDFAKFNPTYVGAPLDTYEKTGQILANRWTQNVDRLDKIGETLSNISSSIDPKNQGILDDAQAKINTTLSGIGTNYQFADGAIREATRYITQNDMLRAAQIDYENQIKNRQQNNQALIDGKTTQEGLKATNIMDQVVNSKPLTKDPVDGSIQNRYKPMMAPADPKVSDKIIALTKIITSHPDEITKWIDPDMAGYLKEAHISFVDSNKVAATLKSYLSNQPEIKGYYDYINNANMIAQYAKTDGKGNFQYDNNGNLLYNDITPEDFKNNTGLQIDDNWNILSDKKTVRLPDGTTKEVQMDNTPNNLLVSSNVKSYFDTVANAMESVVPGSSDIIKSGFNDVIAMNGVTQQDVIRAHYLNQLTSDSLDRKVDFAGGLGYQKNTTKEVELKGYWQDRQWRHEKELTQPAYIISNTNTPYKSENFNIDDYKNTLTGINDQLQKVSKDSQEYSDLTRRKDDVENSIKMFTNSFANTNLGQRTINNAWKEYLDGLSPNLQTKYKDTKYFNEFKDYLSGSTEELTNLDHTIGKSIISPPGYAPSSKGYPEGSTTVLKNIDYFKNNFDKTTEDAVKTSGVALSGTAAWIYDTNNKLDTIHNSLGTFAISNSGSFEVPGAEGGVKTLDQYIANKIPNFNPSEYTITAAPNNPTAGVGGVWTLNIVPNNNYPKERAGKPATPISIQNLSVTPSNIESNLHSLAGQLYNNASSPEVQKLAKNLMVSSIYGKDFDQALLEYKLLNAAGKPTVPYVKRFYGTAIANGNLKDNSYLELREDTPGSGNFITSLVQEDKNGIRNAQLNETPMNIRSTEQFLFDNYYGKQSK